mmetsp:Transcript_7241/g.6424  ORF Transcript_7241/g.6424 Transcript_7241/m.6424 type:complete len:93 (+) Transcript_7241:174-452(+)
MEESLPPLMFIPKNIQLLVQQLIIIRNKILNLYTESRIKYESLEVHDVYTKQDVAEYGILYDKLLKTDFLKNHNLWEIPIKIIINGCMKVEK